MGVRHTTDSAVALYDSVSGLAFGPVFANPFDAEDFVAWYLGRVNNAELADVDLRMLATKRLVELVGEWDEARELQAEQEARERVLRYPDGRAIIDE